MVIHGAAGAVGSTAVQLARWAGAEVIGAGRSRARQLVMELGADRFIALDTDRLEDAAGQADVVFDLVGGEVLARSAGLAQARRGADLGGLVEFPPAGTRPSASTARASICWAASTSPRELSR